MRQMPIAPTASIGIPFQARSTPAFSAAPSDIEAEVIGLFDQFRGPVLRYVVSFGISMHDGEEVTQEVFLALFRHLRLSGGRQNLRGWIFRVAHNLALKQRHANHRRCEAAESDWAIAENQFDPSPNPEDEASFTQKRQRLLTVLHALPKGDQCCLRLRAEGLRYREIAEVLEISLGAVSMSLTRSLARLIRAEGI
jgi:RNA polymerase sigma-70 factor (ECF subfamily)